MSLRNDPEQQARWGWRLCAAVALLLTALVGAWWLWAALLPFMLWQVRPLTDSPRALVNQENTPGAPEATDPSCLPDPMETPQTTWVAEATPLGPSSENDPLIAISQQCAAHLWALLNKENPDVNTTHDKKVCEALAQIINDQVIAPLLRPGPRLCMLAKGSFRCLRVSKQAWSALEQAFQEHTPCTRTKPWSPTMRSSCVQQWSACVAQSPTLQAHAQALVRPEKRENSPSPVC